MYSYKTMSELKYLSVTVLFAPLSPLGTWFSWTRDHLPYYRRSHSIACTLPCGSFKGDKNKTIRPDDTKDSSTSRTFYVFRWYRIFFKHFIMNVHNFNMISWITSCNKPVLSVIFLPSISFRLEISFAKKVFSWIVVLYKTNVRFCQIWQHYNCNDLN